MYELCALEVTVLQIFSSNCLQTSPFCYSFDKLVSKKILFCVAGVGVEKILVFMEVLTHFCYSSISSSIGSILVYEVKSFSSVYSILPTI